MPNPMSPDVPTPLRLRVGDGVVDLATREILMPGARGPRRVTPKAIGVLRMLARVPGAVVGRSELLAEVWPDTLPTDDVLTQAITQLRKAFTGETGSVDKRYIETIAKGGYRLTVPVDVMHAESASVADHTAQEAESPPVPHRRPASAIHGHRGWLLVCAALLLLAIGALGVWTTFEAVRTAADPLSGSPGPTPVSLPYRLITNATGFELSPSLSPDASMVAYSASGPGDADRQSTIMVQTTSSAAPRPLSRPPPGARDDLPAWSPDGREIAFARWEANGACRVLLMPAAGIGDEREIARCDGSDLLSFDWLPNGKELLFGTMTGAENETRLRILDPVSGRWRGLDYPGAAGDLDFAPQVSPDGRWIGFIRNPQMGDLWRVPIEGGTPEQITHLGAEFRGWSWSPDGEGMVFGLRVDSEARLYLAQIDDGMIVDMGIEDAQSPSISAANGMMAFVHRRPQFGLYRVESETGEWRRLFTSSGRDSQPILAPDGRQIVFTSDRAGRFELWWSRLDSPDSLRPIAGVRPDTRQPPIWSADSRHLIVTALDDANAPMILEIEPESGRIERLPLSGSRPAQAAYGPSGTLFVIEGAGADEGGTTLVAYDRTTWKPKGRISDVSQVRFDKASGRVFYTRLDASGLWMAPPTLDMGAIVRLSESVPSRWRYRSWSVTEDGAIIYLDAAPSCRSRMSRYRIEDQLLASVDSVCVDPVIHSSTNGLSTANGAWFVSLASEDGSDIGFMTIPPPRLQHAGFFKWLISKRKQAS
ncbi:winged helix-turn-helix domain-containing protein [Luteimonas fraxinea]|uniref:winged helix-turn-helix domain-containing protein n=1 Tax=Luteimonas fraxinea TaxID=2901869 RepID=UPI001E302BC7|nr:winged helix-turn-helix domain-containing protein [Luteimonas fraxinea]UHH08780.1 winged helix-turn-helix domain-containing protein [Luteimonas fraxinea]